MKIEQTGIFKDGGSELYKLTFDDGREQVFKIDYRIGSNTQGLIFTKNNKLVENEAIVKFIKAYKLLKNNLEWNEYEQ